MSAIKITIIAVAILTEQVVARTGPQTSAGIAFEVASVKANVSGDPRTQFQMPSGGQFVIVNAPLREIVRVAYEIQDFQLVGAPEWTRTARFDINARASRDITLVDTPGST